MAVNGIEKIRIEDFIAQIPDISIRAGEITITPFHEADCDDYQQILTQCDIFSDLQAPYAFPWARAIKHDPTQASASIAFQRDNLAKANADNFTVPFLVRYQDVLVGSQDLRAESFSSNRLVHSGSWLAVDYQGRGLGSIMRRALLIFAFEKLGATAAFSQANPSNLASIHTSLACGYKQIQPSDFPNPPAAMLANPHESLFLVTPKTFIRKTVQITVQIG